MKTEFKRHKTKCKFLILMLAMTALTACKGDSYMEISETVEPVGSVEYNEVETGEPEILDDVQSLSIMEIYESFLNGELTVAFEEQQIYISDLFWDNDKESVWQQESVYCVFLQWYSQKWAGGSAKRNPSYGCPVC